MPCVLFMEATESGGKIDVDLNKWVKVEYGFYDSMKLLDLPDRCIFQQRLSFAFEFIKDDNDKEAKKFMGHLKSLEPS
jgi:hypothetical protein